MKNFFFLAFTLIFSINFVSAQDSEEDVPEISTVEALLLLVKEGKTKEQSVNADREAQFLADKNKQASILAAEKKRISKTRKNCRSIRRRI